MNDESRVLKLALLVILIIGSQSIRANGIFVFEIPVGARESAFGGSGVALVTGATSAAHNPAALAELKYTSFAAPDHAALRRYARESFFSLNIQGTQVSRWPRISGGRVFLIWNTAQRRRRIPSASLTRLTPL